MIPDQKIKIVIFKLFMGEARTGADRYLISLIEMLSKKFDVEVRECFPIKFKNHRRLFSIISIPASIVCTNIETFKLLKSGNQVLSGYLSGSIYIQQSFNQNELTSRFNLLFKYYSLIDYVSRFGKNNTRLIIYVSNFAKENCRLKKKGINEYVIYPSIIDDIPDSKYSDKEDIIVTVSRIASEKKLDKILKIMENLPYPHYLIGFSTDKLYLEKLRTQLKKTKIILDAPEDVKNDYLRRAKIFLNTSENEPFGLVIVEAMAYGVLPIAHKSGGPSEILPREFLYSDEKDAEELIKKYMVEYNEKIYNEMRQRAREFTKDKVEHQLYQAITETFGQ